MLFHIFVSNMDSAIECKFANSKLRDTVNTWREGLPSKWTWVGFRGGPDL